MTDEEINVAIANECPVAFRVIDGKTYWANDDGLCYICNDLNAMHEVEQTFTVEQYDKFSDELYDLETRRAKLTGRWGWLSATARQRAEAFLRTVGKWKEASND